MLLLLLGSVIITLWRNPRSYVYVDLVKFIDHMSHHTFTCKHFEIADLKTVFNTKFVGVFISICTPNFTFLGIINRY